MGNTCKNIWISLIRGSISNRDLACQNKAVSHMLHGNLYVMGNADLITRNTKMTSTRLGAMGRQELSILPLSIIPFTIDEGRGRVSPLKGTPKQCQDFRPYQNQPFRGSYHNKRSNYKKIPLWWSSYPNQQSTFLL